MPGSLLRKFSKRRRPTPHTAKIVKNPIFAEDENYSISEVDGPYIKQSKPKSSIMQRFSNWIGEHLGNKNKRRDGRRSDSETRTVITGPVVRDSGRKVPQMFGNSGHYSNFGSDTQKQYELKRRAVCTNPWFNADSACSMNTEEFLDAMYSSSHLTRDESLRINTLAGSASCSSGYGSNSNDSSPECSVHQPHWQPSSQIENRGDLVDKAVECHSLDLDEALGIPSIDDEDGDYSHIYYELEPTLSQLKTQTAAYADDSCYSGSVELNTNASSRSDSPIYAIPCSSSAGESQCGSIEYVDDSDGYSELAKRCQPEPPLNNPPMIVERNGNGYARLQRQVDRPSAFTRCVPRLPSPKFYAPPPPPLTEFPRTCLDLLDEQIAELKMKTEVVSRLVETAKERRELRDYARNLCMEHIKDLRNLRLYVERGFELHI